MTCGEWSESMNDLMLAPGDTPFVDDDGAATPEGIQLANLLVAYARSLESEFGTLRQQMRDYERLWRLQAVRWQPPADKTFDQHLPAFAANDPRILVDKAIRANTRERVGWRVKLEAKWAQRQRDATQDLERYAYAWHWMSDRERRESGRLFPLQYTLSWFGSVRGGAILIPYLRNSPRQRAADEYGAATPFLTRTPDPLYSVWDDDGCFFASQDFRNPRQYRHIPDIGSAKVHKGTKLCETWNIWWKDGNADVWNCTVTGERCFIVPPTNHTTSRRLKYLPVYIDAPLFGAPAEATIGDSDQFSLAARHEGILHASKDVFAVNNYLNSCFMVLLQDSVYWTLLNTTGTKIPEEVVKDAFRRRGVLNVPIAEGDRGSVQPIPPPQLSNSIEVFQGTLNRMMQLGGMPDTALAGVSEGMTGVAIQEAALQGDYKAGPISDMLRRLYEDGLQCVWGQQRALGRKVRVSGRDRTDLVIADFAPQDLPRDGDFILEAVHTPTLVRDAYREAQTAMTWRNAGRSFPAIADEQFDDPQREVALSREERVEALPHVAALLEADTMRRKYPDRPDIWKPLFLMAKQMVDQMVAQAAPASANGKSPATQPGMDMAAEPMPQLPGGPAAPPDVNPANPGDAAALGAIGGSVPQGPQGGY